MDKLYIVKIGGNVINDNEHLKKFIKAFSAIPGHKILVHGGGKIVDELSGKLNIPQQMVNGRRITDGATLDVATMVYAGLINKTIVALLQSHKMNAIGLTGADNNAIRTKKRAAGDVDFGWVGDMVDDSINTAFISMLLGAHIAPVFCSITHDNAGQLYNTNADTIASSLAIALSLLYDVQLIYCFEKKGVLQDPEDDNSVMRTITAEAYQMLKEKHIVSKGMIPKLDNAFKALSRGVHAVVIAHADDVLNVINDNTHTATHLIA